MTTREIVTAYIRAIEAGDRDELERLVHPDVVCREHPSKFFASGATSDRAAMRAAGERGARAMSSQRYEIRGMIVEGDRAALQIAWSATLAVAFGALPVGHVMRAEVCSVIELKDGRIWRQEQYDCYL